MTRMQKLIIFGNYLGVGIFSPVLALFLQSHGCNNQTLAVVMGVFSITVILAELPSGIVCDLYGRKISYLLYGIFTCISFFIMYFSYNLIVLGWGMFFLGLGVAFSSGSLDSLIIEDYIQKNGEDGLSKVTGMLAICESAGISIGALLGGIIPNNLGYLYVVIMRISILIIISLLSWIFLNESLLQRNNQRTLNSHVKKSISILKESRTLRILLLCISGSSIMLFAIETYWQAQFKVLVSNEGEYLLGIIYSCGYVSTMVGNYFMGKKRMTSLRVRWMYYLTLIIVMAVSLVILSIQNGIIGFIGFYMINMLLTGSFAIPEQTLINTMVTNETRASFLSLSSLFSKFGGIISSSICAGIVLDVGISGIWMVTASITIVIIIIAAIKLKSIEAVTRN